jgi:hypothetical protein
MNKQERELIKMVRDDMDDNPVSQAVFKIQTIIEDVYQQGINIGEAIGAAKFAYEVERKVGIDTKPARKSCKKTTTSKGEL